MFNDITFANPEMFWLLLILPALILWQFIRRKNYHPSLRLSSTAGLPVKNKPLKVKLRYLPFVLRLISITLIITALARPQSSSSEQSITTEGIDIVIALDVSSSMLARDFDPDRLEAAKETAVQFIKGRPNDRIGLVVFAAESFTQCPVTIDHDILINLLDNIKTGTIPDGTAIGMGLATSVARLKDLDSKSKVVILLTDGVNNRGSIAPLTASEIADTYGIRVYTIGVGTKGQAPYPVKDRFGRTRIAQIEVNIDEPILENIADQTGGKYFRATNKKALESIFQDIDRLEKTKIDVAFFTRYTEEYLPLAIAGAVILLIELLSRMLYFRNLS
ncbi:MAG: vWA domain-containing protein [Candidatus Kapaibacterium sp.]